MFFLTFYTLIETEASNKNNPINHKNNTSRLYSSTSKIFQVLWYTMVLRMSGTKEVDIVPSKLHKLH